MLWIMKSALDTYFRSPRYRLRRQGGHGARTSYCWLAVLISFTTLGLISSACDNTVDPFTEQQEEFFVIYGYLDTAADTQKVRINPITRALDQSIDQGDIVVSSTILETGETVVWSDSLIQLEDGSNGFLFYALFSPQPGRTYRLDIHGVEGLQTSAHTTVPETPHITVHEPAIGVFGLTSQQIVINDYWSPRNLGVQYHVIPLDKNEVETHLITYHGVGFPGNEGWEVVVQLERDFRMLVRDIYTSPDDTTMAFVGVGLVYDRLSDDWQNQGLELNIVNGHGFFGSIGRYYSEWSIDSTTVRDIGFIFPGAVSTYQGKVNIK